MNNGVQSSLSAKGAIMKKIYRVLATFLSLFLVLSVRTYAYDPANSGISYSPTSDSMIYTNTQNFNQGAIVNAFNTLPANVRSLFRKEGVRIYFTAGVGINERGYYGCTVSPNVSYYEGSNKVVSVNKRTAIYLYPDADIATTVPHECGHALDCIAGYATGKYIGEYGISTGAEWKSVYNNNFSALGSVDGMINYHVQKGATEAFADAFRLYCTNPNGLNAACPEVYNFIGAQIAKYAGGSAPAPANTGVTKKNFDAKAYADTYPDLKAAFGYDKNALWNHYINYGKAEGRTVTAVQ